jgi:hypothetical protein
MMEITLHGLDIAIQETGCHIRLDGDMLSLDDTSWFEIYLEDGKRYTSADLNTTICQDSSGLFTLCHHSSDGLVQVRTCLYCENTEIRISHDVCFQWPDTPQRAWLALPWLSSLFPGNGRVFYPAMTQAKQDGRDAMQHQDAYPLPLRLVREDGSGIAVHSDLCAPGLTWDSLRNQDLGNISNARELHELRFPIKANGRLTRIVQLALEPFTGGDRSFWDLMRRRLRANVDFSQYQREDLQWFSKVKLFHFAYAYSRECFDYEKGRFDMPRLLAQGAAFGGYDAVLIWHQYPRLGIDSRDQWDFFNAFPGGIRALREAVDYAHSKGVYVLLPYKPWDRTPSDSDEIVAHKLTALIRATDVDGIFLDTMHTLPASFRTAADSAKPGVVFVSEGTPQVKPALETLTASWDQYWNDVAMPETPLIRYLFPEHVQCAIARWHVGRQKDIAIQRALFNGCGMVIWQDIFGEWLPYNAAQQERIRELKDLLHTYADCFEGKPTPLIETNNPQVFANLFESLESAVLCVYNQQSEAVKAMIILPCQQVRAVTPNVQVELIGKEIAVSLPAQTCALLSLVLE